MTALKSYVSNATESTLSSALGVGATTVNVVSTTGFPAVPFYAVLEPAIDVKREVVLATEKTATTLTVTRAQDGTTDVTHDSGVSIKVVPVAAHISDLHDRVDAVNTTATAAYTPGGADVAVADGGTGASTAATARTNLEVPADADVVKLTGAQTVAGVKTFSSAPVIPAPTTDFEAATKKYVDDNAPTEVFLAATHFALASGTPAQALIGNQFPIWLLDDASAESISAVASAGMFTGWTTFDIELWWSKTHTNSGNVRFQVTYETDGAGGTLDSGATNVQATDASADLHVVNTVAMASGIAVPSAGSVFNMRVMRLGDDAADTMTGDAAFLGIRLVKAS